MWSEAVTNHPASQRANLELGVKETGILFGFVPTSMRMRNLPGLPRRGSLLLFYTRTGRAMRAVSHDFDSASLMGVNVNRTIVFTFALGSGLAGAGAIEHLGADHQQPPRARRAS